MFNFLKDYFRLSHKETRGALMLLFLLVLFFLVPKIYFHYQKPEIVSSDDEFETWIASIEKQDSLNKYAKKKSNKLEDKFPFDFNTVTFTEMKRY